MSIGNEQLSDIVLEDLVDDHTRSLIRGRRIGKTHRRGWIVRRALLAADVIGLLLAYSLAEIVTGAPANSDKVSPWFELAGFLATIPLWLVLARLFGLYERDEERADYTTVDDATGVFVLVTVGVWLLIVLAWVTRLANPYMPKLLAFWLAAVVLVSLSRAVTRSCVRRSDAYQQNTVLVGAGDIAQLLASKILRHPEYGINLLGFVDDLPRSRRDDIGDLTVLDDIEQLPRIVEELDVERVIVAFSGQTQGELLEDLRTLRTKDVQIDVVPRFFDIVGPGADFHAIEGFPLVGLAAARLPRSSMMLKRALDITGAAFGLLILFPVFVYVAIRIKLDSTGPVLYRSRRPGRGGTHITVMKFRTMQKAPAGSTETPFGDDSLEAEYKLNYKLRDDPRVTNFGKTLRRTSLDELPQLINVLRGDMSLVGPRPMLVEELETKPQLEELLVVKPGITGYWQINGRSDVDYGDRFRLEASYVASWSLGLDLTILAKTIRSVIQRSGAR